MRFPDYGKRGDQKRHTVSYSLADHETKKREIEALYYACKSLKKEEGLI